MVILEATTVSVMIILSWLFFTLGCRYYIAKLEQSSFQDTMIKVQNVVEKLTGTIAVITVLGYSYSGIVSMLMTRRLSDIELLLIFFIPTAVAYPGIVGAAWLLEKLSQPFGWKEGG